MLMQAHARFTHLCEVLVDYQFRLIDGKANFCVRFYYRWERIYDEIPEDAVEDASEGKYVTQQNH